MKALALIVMAGCLPSSSVICGDGRICPDDQVCAHVTDPDEDLCADPGQIQACAGQPTYTHCGANGRCYDGVCLPIACGNGRIDRPDPANPADDGEVCDDGNERSGDGCASDCRSDETCGNGVVDPIDLERCDDGNRISNDGCDSTCEPERARWRRIITEPAYRSRQVFAYDLFRDRMVMFGGGPFDDSESAETWEAVPTGFTQLAPETSPSPRRGAAMIYDVARRETMLFGGEVSGQTWLWDGASWSEALAIDGPRPRRDHAMAYDTRRTHTVLFGGKRSNSLGDDNETWEWDGTTWTHKTPSTRPPGHSKHAMAYDPRRGVVVMWGGLADSSVWEYDGIDWRESRAAGAWPASRDYPSMAWDPIGQRILMVGGELNETELGDVWTWNGSQWQSLGVLAPAIYPGHVMATDVRRGRVVLFGSTTIGGGPADASTWTWDGAAWTYRSMATSGDPLATSAVLDPLRARIVLLGVDATSEFDGFGWTPEIHDPGGDRRTHSALAYDAARRGTVMFGGQTDSDTIFGDTWVLDTSGDGPIWLLRPTPTAPSPRVSIGLAFAAHTARVMLFGGAACAKPECDVFDDTWEWNGAIWTLVSPQHRPPARGSAAFAYDPIRRQIVMFGGAGQGVLGDTWTWDGADWTEQHPQVYPSPRTGATLAWDAKRRRLVLYGGATALSAASDEVWEWDGATWTRVVVVDSPSRTGHAFASATGRGVVVFDGFTSPGQPTSELDELRWEGTSTAESCRSIIDADHDGLAGCADPDCWWACTPLCPPGASCDPTAPHCGDGECNALLEDGWICPADCARPMICGDSICDPGENACPGDCP